MTSRSSILTAIFVICSLTPSSASADGFDGQRFSPAAGSAGGLIVERPAVPLHLGWGAGLLLDYALNPVIIRDEVTGEITGRPLRHAMTFDLLASLGLFDLFEIALHLPVHALYVGDDTATGGQTFGVAGGLGDLRLVPKFAYWLGGSSDLGFAIGLALPLSLPTGDDDELRGAGGVTIEPRLLLALGTARWALTTNLGYQNRIGDLAPDLAGRGELTYGVAGTFGLLDGTVPLDLQAELVGGWLPSSSQPGGVKTPLELLAGVIVWPHPEWSIYTALGPGLTRGLGTPDFRVAVGVRYAHRVPGRDRFSDTDGDRIPDWRDDCRESSEDYDGYEDDDGCPEIDNDLDGVLDDADECPTQAEEAEGNGDGCPDKARVIIRRGKVVVFGKVQFQTGSAEILPRSGDLLDQIADVLKKNPEIKKMMIEGHTDNTGGRRFNLALSGNRAKSVKRALIERGVDDQRLETKGLGETRPLAPNETPAGRARNRRVEFKAIR